MAEIIQASLDFDDLLAEPIKEKICRQRKKKLEFHLWMNLHH